MHNIRLMTYVGPQLCTMGVDQIYCTVKVSKSKSGKFRHFVKCTINLFHSKTAENIWIFCQSGSLTILKNLMETFLKTGQIVHWGIFLEAFHICKQGTLN